MEHPRYAFKIIISFLVIWTAVANVIAAAQSEIPGDFLDQQKLHSRLIVNLFLQQIEKGEINVFGRILRTAELQEHSVSYEHKLKDDSIAVSIHFKLKIRIPVPGFATYYVEAISVDIDKDGHIEKIRTHVKPLQL